MLDAILTSVSTLCGGAFMPDALPSLGVLMSLGDVGPKAWAYAGFLGLVVAFLVLDLKVIHKEAHEIKMKEAVIWSIIWLLVGLVFSVFVYYAYENHWLQLGLNTPMYNPEKAAGVPTIIEGTVNGYEAAKQYLTGYVIERTLAMDNIFVIALIFSYYAVPARYQHRVLFWGIIGAVVMRGVMIFLGAALILQYQWILIIFGLFLIFTAIKMMTIAEHTDPSSNWTVKLCKKYFRLMPFYDGQRFFTKRTIAPTYSTDPKTGHPVQDPPPEGSLSAKWSITPLFLALVIVEFTDLVFSVDSIPAIFAITPDPFIIFTSNIFAIFGLRALYFCLAALIMKFRYLKPALVLILVFVGIKLLLISAPPYLDNIGSWIGQTWQARPPIKVGTGLSLGLVVGALMAGVFASILNPGSPDEPEATEGHGQKPGGTAH